MASVQGGQQRGVHARTLGYPWVLRGVRDQDPSALSTDEGLEESGPALNGKAKEKGAHLVPQAVHRVVFVQGLLKEGTTALLKLIDQEGQHRQKSKDAGQVLFSVAVVVFEMVALVFERVEGFVFYFPAGQVLFLVETVQAPFVPQADRAWGCRFSSV